MLILSPVQMSLSIRASSSASARGKIKPNRVTVRRVLESELARASSTSPLPQDAMTQDDWSTLLDNHPIFTLPKCVGGPAGQLEESLELSTNTLRNSLLEGPVEDGLSLSGRRQVMALKDSDLIVAAGCELRITSLSDSKLGRNTNKSFKVRPPTLTHVALPWLTA